MSNARIPGAHVRLPRPTSRSVILLVLALVVAVCGVIDQRSSVSRPTSIARDLVGAAPASAVSSAWYCPLITKGGAVTVLNPQAQALSGSISFVGNNDLTAEVPLNVAPRSRAVVPLAIDSPYVSALVRLAGGGASVDQLVRTASGDASTACAPTASQHWYFADGSTESGASLQIGVFNPFTENAIVDANFTTSDGDSIPQNFQGIVVPPMKMVVLDVSGNVRRRDFVASSITLRSGRAAVAQLQTGVIGGRAVAGYTVGAPSLSLTQYVPDIETPDGRHSVLSLFNPSDAESHVEVDNVLDTGTALPFDLRVPAGTRISVVFDAEQRIPKASFMGAVVKVLNGVAITSQVSVTTTAPPNASNGGAFMTGPPAAARQWMFASGSVDAASDGWLYVFNPSTAIADVAVTLTGDGNASTQTPVRVAPGKRYGLHINDLSPNAAASIVVNSSQDVVVAREIDVSGGAGPIIAAGTPVR